MFRQALIHHRGMASWSESHRDFSASNSNESPIASGVRFVSMLWRRLEMSKNWEESFYSVGGASSLSHFLGSKDDVPL